MSETITSSMEDYLECIYHLSLKKGYTRIRDIAKAAGVKKASVTQIIHKLSKIGLVDHEHYGYVELTPKGEEIAKRVVRTHEILVKFIHGVLGVDRSKAEEDACRLEHHISEETLSRFVTFLDFVESCPQGVPDWLNHYFHYLETGQRPDICKYKGGKR